MPKPHDMPLWARHPQPTTAPVHRQSPHRLQHHLQRHHRFPTIYPCQVERHHSPIRPIPIQRHLTSLPQHQSHHTRTTRGFPSHLNPPGSRPHQCRPYRPSRQHCQHFTPRSVSTQHTPLCQLPWLFCPGRPHHPQPTPRPKRVRSHHPQHLATPQELPLNHHHTPRLGCGHQIHFRWRRTSHDPPQRAPRRRLPPEGPLLGDSPGPRHSQRTGLVHQLHSTRHVTPHSTTSKPLPPPPPPFVSPHHTNLCLQQQKDFCSGPATLSRCQVFKLRRFCFAEYQSELFTGFSDDVFNIGRCLAFDLSVRFAPFRNMIAGI